METKTIRLGLLPPMSDEMVEWFYNYFERANPANCDAATFTATRQTWFSVDDVQNCPKVDVPPGLQKEFLAIQRECRNHHLICFGWGRFFKSSY